MNKAPAMMFYVGDYSQDTRCLSLAARGAWMDCLCAMWRASTRGEITYPIIGFARLFGCTVEQTKAVIDELVEMQICDCVTHDDGKMTVINRRMKRETKEREAANNRQRRYSTRKKQGNDASDDGSNDDEITPPSSYSYADSNTNKSVDDDSPSRVRTRSKPSSPSSGSSPPKSEIHEQFLAQKAAEYPTYDVRAIWLEFAGLCGSERYPKMRSTHQRFDQWLADYWEEFGAENKNGYVNPATGKAMK